MKILTAVIAVSVLVLSMFFTISTEGPEPFLLALLLVTPVTVLEWFINRKPKKAHRPPLKRSKAHYSN